MKFSQFTKLSLITGLALVSAMGAMNANAVDGTISMTATVPFAVNVPSYAASFTVNNANYTTQDDLNNENFSIWTNAGQAINITVVSSNYDATTGYPYLKNPAGGTDEIPFDIYYQGCGNTALPEVELTPKGAGATRTVNMPYSDANQAACVQKPGVLQVQRLALTTLPASGSYAGTVTLTVQQPS